MTPLSPGALSEGMVPMLTAGRSVLSLDGVLVRFVNRAGAPHHLRVELPDLSQNCAHWDRFEYVGEPSNDGWITAPPGGWASNPVGDLWVEAKESSGEINRCPASHIAWRDIIAFRLVDQEGGQAAEPQTAGTDGEGEREDRLAAALTDIMALCEALPQHGVLIGVWERARLALNPDEPLPARQALASMSLRGGR